jgi:UDP-2-acetamido-3-amino-2,3-dideoxy-glucuronate N-acetyltransferase
MESEQAPLYSSIHPTAIVESGATVGPGTRIWHQCHIRSGSRIGAKCTVGFAVFVDTEVVIGDRCKIQNHVSLYRGVILEDDVFVGPSATFTNDMYPRADSSDWKVLPTYVRCGVSLGANSTIVCGVELGAWSLIGAGAVVTANVPAHGLMLGTPARLRGWVCVCGRILSRLGDAIPRTCHNCGRTTDGMVKS